MVNRGGGGRERGSEGGLTRHRRPGLSLILPPANRIRIFKFVPTRPNLFISRNDEERLGLSVRGAGFSEIEVIGDCGCCCCC